MSNGIRLLVLGLAFALTGRASTLVMASGTVLDPSTDSFSVSNSYDESFILLVVGGTGNAFFSPRIAASGEITDGFLDTGSRWATANGYVSTSGFGVGVYAPNNDSTTDRCLFDNGCRLPFTFGVPEEIRITAMARAGYACTAPVPGTDCSRAAGGLQSSVTFDGLGDFTQFYPGVRPPVQFDAQYSLTPVTAGASLDDPTGAPEPGTVALMLSGVAVFCSRRVGTRRLLP